MITFLYNYSNDIVRFKTKAQDFISDTLNADNLYGLGGHILIPKSALKRPVQIYLNENFVGAVTFRKRYSLAHLEFNRQKNTFTLRYHKYRFIFI